MEGRTGGVEQDSTSTKELETVIQGGTRGGVQQSSQQDSGEEPATASFDSKKFRESDVTFINIGSTIIRVGSFESCLGRHG